MREVDVALFGLALVAHHVDFVTGLELGIALVIENLGNRRHAFRLRAYVYDDMGRGQLDDGALDYVVLAYGFFGFSLEVLEGGSEIIIAERTAIAGGLFMGAGVCLVLVVYSGSFGRAVLLGRSGNLFR